MTFLLLLGVQLAPEVGLTSYETLCILRDAIISLSVCSLVCVCVCVCVCVHFPFRRLTFNGKVATAIRPKFQKAHFRASFARLTFGSRYEVIESRQLPNVLGFSRFNACNCVKFVCYCNKLRASRSNTFNFTLSLFLSLFHFVVSAKFATMK